MNFSDPSLVGDVIHQMKTVEINRATKRALIDNLFNGLPPYTAQEEKENKIYVNVNFKEGVNALHAARGQYENAFLKPGNFFTITLEDAPIDKQAEWSTVVTEKLNGMLKESRPYIHTQRNKFAGVALHGVGAQMWEDQENPIPFFVGMQDILIPTDTEITLENLTYFAVRRRIRPGSLFKKTFFLGDNVDPGWNLPFVQKILDNANRNGFSGQPQTTNWVNNPEQMAELWKQNSSYYDSDRAPEVVMWDFYYLEDGQEDRKPGWYRCIILDTDCVQVASGDAQNPVQFVYQSKGPEADNIEKIIHFQFGDGNNVPPFKYHSIRSLGWLLYDVVQLMNRARCQFTQHVFEQMLALFRIANENDRAKLQKILLADKGIIPEGASMVPAAERYQADYNLVNGLLSGMKQLINESSSSYTQQIDNGTQKERTKFEVEAIMSQISSLMSSMLNLAYIQEYFAYKEICRRFTIQNSTNFQVKHFISECIMEGVDKRYLNSSRWKIAVEQVIGSGNKMLEIAQARELRNMRPTLDPEAQRKVDRIYISALTDNAKLAQSLVPNSGIVTDSMHDAELSFGTLMQGVPVSPKDGLNRHEQVTTLLKLMGVTIKRIQGSGGVGSPQDIIGLQNVAQFIQQQIAFISEDPDERAQVKEYNDILGNFMNFVRAFAQRQEQAQKADQSQQGVDPAAMAKAQVQIQLLQQKLQMSEQKHQQEMAQSAQRFQQEQAQKNIQTVTDIQRKNSQAIADVRNDAVVAASQNDGSTSTEEG